ncbi:MAG: prevent-host-death protein [Armatimonadetes bacterium CG2_30_59_28]|nr:type II toxin-antitoxin system Phd/YefM family antitoxin [Armatimonadota bacterium]OIO97902.1 MAG: prevent-host-death protein [Armatimonadetes bacterium CG2_30_59_28]PIU65979.1 MAG: type II toxin-antitoxin system Phd/YefM family antitoxin [Armatimonadetes bacterium CG07_land_8_20_14_0_80_59_28]PIX42400.1 MAG: type II toxin-antitoxin system Phd/YefM family antitoxin [Armatimonadetes bacterium CG_4_8_14_3_um_filter_58_9]PIY44137.1 MAG: type II toxin-antitoxin system Phd/YefM family antitoxin [
MNLKEDIRPITYLKSRAANPLQQINTTHRPVVITQNGEPRAVLQDPVSYEQMRDALGLLKLLAQGEEDVRPGRTTSQQEVFSAIRRRLRERKAGDEEVI